MSSLASSDWPQPINVGDLRSTVHRATEPRGGKRPATLQQSTRSSKSGPFCSHWMYCSSTESAASVVEKPQSPGCCYVFNSLSCRSNGHDEAVQLETTGPIPSTRRSFLHRYWRPVPANPVFCQHYESSPFYSTYHLHPTASLAHFP